VAHHSEPVVPVDSVAGIQALQTVNMYGDTHIVTQTRAQASSLDHTLLHPHHLHAQKRTMPTGHNQQRRNTKCHGDKISRHALGPQAKLEGPHCYEEEANRAQIIRIILATWKEVATIYRKQTLVVQNNYKTDLDIWHRNLELCQQIESSYTAESTIENPTHDHKRPLVCV
jgi:hypothetical protein